MDKLVLAGLGAIVAIVASFFAIQATTAFIDAHWEDIYALLVLGIIFGVPVTVGVIAIGKR